MGKFASTGANPGYNTSIVSDGLKETTMSTTPTLTTADELFLMPDDGFRYELVKGELRRMPPAGGEHGAVAINSAVMIAQFVKARGLGVVFAADTGFKIASEPDTVRVPDLAFVRRERIADGGIPREFWPGAPDLAVEVISPGDTYTEVEEKVHDWLNAGALMVLVLNQRTHTVTIYTSHTDVVRLTTADTLDGGEVLPGFTCRVAELFVLTHMEDRFAASNSWVSTMHFPEIGAMYARYRDLLLDRHRTGPAHPGEGPVGT
jgi:Uma2 family endonuclease